MFIYRFLIFAKIVLMARRRKFCLRTVWFLFLVTCVWLQQHILSFSNNRSDALVEVNDLMPQILHKYLIARPKNNSAALLNISEISRNIAKLNEIQEIYNVDIYGPMLEDTVIIVIQVHRRIIYLRYLIVSLAQVRNISKVLLVFSHDYYNEELNELVQSVDFCKVMQIFYPYSIQTHPNEFPGEDPNDCSRDLEKQQALIRKCNNALFPDLYGHYREAKFTQTKHHWWWKANRVFNQLEITRNHSGIVVFLEEDHYVAQDFIHVLKLMEMTRKVMCRKCNILSLGNYNYYGDSKKVEITPWIGNRHNMGMAFNRTTWREIMKCTEYFCQYDDYNWDWSLQHISQTCLTNKLYTMVLKRPRVFHIGECGLHHNKSNCASSAIISKVQKFLKAASKDFYPNYLTLTFNTNNNKHKLRKGNGGWGDHRDHELCINQTRIHT